MVVLRVGQQLNEPTKTIALTNTKIIPTTGEGKKGRERMNPLC